MYIQKILKWKSHTHTCTSVFFLQVFHVCYSTVALNKAITCNISPCKCDRDSNSGDLYICYTTRDEKSLVW